MPSENLKSSEVLNLLEKRESYVKEYVADHELNIYQLNKIIRAESAMKNRNSLMQFLNKEKRKLKGEGKKEESEEPQHVDRENIKDMDELNQAIQEDNDTISNLKNQLDTVEQSWRKVKHDRMRINEKKQDRRERMNLVNELKNRGFSENTLVDCSIDELKQLKQDTQRKKKLKSESAIREEINEYIESYDFHKHLEEQNKSLISRVKSKLSFSDSQIFNNILTINEKFESFKTLEKEEKIFKTGLLTKKYYEHKLNSKKELSFKDIATLMREIGVGNEDKVVSFFKMLDDYDYPSDFNHHDVDGVIESLEELTRP